MNRDGLKLGYEVVFTVTDYYDGPLRGIANYHDSPHFYDCIFDEAQNEYSELFRITPVDSATFDLAMEAWEIWRRRELAFHTGKTTDPTHFALPQDADRCGELERTLEKVLVVDPQRSRILKGEFEVYGKHDLPKGVVRPLQVKWSQPQGPSHLRDPVPGESENTKD
jgi:hypothetical protein